ncbi:hypothetical protein GNF78_16895, partial [Clostridium perfringens]
MKIKHNLGHSSQKEGKNIVQKYDGATELLNSAIESMQHVFSCPIQV